MRSSSLHGTSNNRQVVAIQFTLVPTPPYCSPGCILALEPWLGSCVPDSSSQFSSSQKGPRLSLFPEGLVSAFFPSLCFPLGPQNFPTLRSFSLLGLNTDQILTNTLELLLPLRLFTARTQGLTCFPPRVGYFQISLASKMPSFQYQLSLNFHSSISFSFPGIH